MQKANIQPDSVALVSVLVATAGLSTLTKKFCQVERQHMQIGQINKRMHLCTIYTPNVLHYSDQYFRASIKRMFQLSRTERNYS
jgi:hypothetical protein